MKKLILLLLFFSICSYVHADDRVRIQVQFRQAIWTCPIDGMEEFEDRPMEGGASYEHTCKNGHTFNQSGSNMREYNGTVNYLPSEYETLKVEDLAIAKQALVTTWLDGVKNPPPYIEPTAEDIQKEIDSKQEEIASLQARKAELEEDIMPIGDTPISE